MALAVGVRQRAERDARRRFAGRPLAGGPLVAGDVERPRVFPGDHAVLGPVEVERSCPASYARRHSSTRPDEPSSMPKDTRGMRNRPPSRQTLTSC